MFLEKLIKKQKKIKFNYFKIKIEILFLNLFITTTKQTNKQTNQHGRTTHNE
jgi:hypothetical protein